MRDCNKVVKSWREVKFTSPARGQYFQTTDEAKNGSSFYKINCFFKNGAGTVIDGSRILKVLTPA